MIYEHQNLFTIGPMGYVCLHIMTPHWEELLDLSVSLHKYEKRIQNGHCPTRYQKERKKHSWRIISRCIKQARSPSYNAMDNALLAQTICEKQSSAPDLGNRKFPETSQTMKRTLRNTNLYEPAYKGEKSPCFSLLIKDTKGWKE